jgi:hypothetical protein
MFVYGFTKRFSKEITGMFLKLFEFIAEMLEDMSP